jgi:glycosyltransferase involved in cell wall biosynthesis
MKVAIYFPSRYGGVKDVCENLVTGLRKRGFEVIAINSHRFALFYLFKSIFSFSEKHVHISNLEFGYVSFFTKKSIYILHGIPERTSYNFIRFKYTIFLFKLFCGSSKKVVSVSFFTEYIWKKFFGVRTDIVIHNPLPESCFINSMKHFDSSVFRFIYVGRIIKEKGVFEIVNSYKEFVESNSSVNSELLIIGKGPEMGNLKSLIDEFHNINVKVLGFVDEDLKQKLFASSHVFVSLHSGEPFGITSAEAGYHGLDLVVSCFGGHLEFIKSKNLFLVSNTYSSSEVSKAFESAYINSQKKMGSLKESSLKNESSLYLKNISFEYHKLISEII